MKISGHRSHTVSVKPDLIATSTLTVKTPRRGFFDITAEARDFLHEAQAAAGALTLFVRHTSASLTIQENADPDVLTDLTDALDRLAPENGGWIHHSEGPDDMPAHIKTMLTSSSLQVPVENGEMMLGTWQGIYLIEHRARPHRRDVVMQFVGSAAH
ncbi:MAG: YjbQ family protein [Afipia felis]|nr:YjbQ family protein [Afipia felis]